MNSAMRRVVFDFDGVIHRYSQGWNGGDIYDPPVEGVKSLIDHLWSHGVEVLVVSTRNTDRVTFGKFEKSQLVEMSAWMKRHNIQGNLFKGKEKPLANFYIDDRGVNFNLYGGTTLPGFDTDWGRVLTEIRELTERMKSVSFDFDGVIHRPTVIDLSKPLFGEVIPGAREALQQLKAEGYKVQIYSCRNSDGDWWGMPVKGQAAEIEKWLTVNQIPFDAVVTSGKPMASAYVDDRMIPFRGDWKPVVEILKTKGVLI